MEHPSYDVCVKCLHDVFKYVIDPETKHKLMVCAECGEEKDSKADG